MSSISTLKMEAAVKAAWINHVKSCGTFQQISFKYGIRLSVSVSKFVWVIGVSPVKLAAYTKVSWCNLTVVGLILYKLIREMKYQGSQRC